ncbi:hypothetical protein PV326_003798 [Microctonus aethiopoides]|nr:hypothetical protein PV326_003798 [Microctonus aethiopoides]
MELTAVTLFIALIAILLGLYYWSTSTYNHWKNLGISGPHPIPLVGNFGSVLLSQQCILEKHMDLYNEWKNEPFFGVFNGSKPILLVNDLEVVKNILIKDFHAFPGRGIEIDEKYEPLEGHLFNIDGHRWKVLREKLTPAFTTGKLKQMVELMIECTEQFEKYLHEQVGEGNIIECREASAKYATDVIGSCAFGLNMNALTKEDCEFRIMGRKLFQPTFLQMISRLFRIYSPKLYKFLRLKSVPPKDAKFFIDTIKTTIEYREKNNIVRHDLVDILKDIKNNQDDIDFEFTEALLASQAFVFFIGGFETSSTTISFALYELANVPEIQDKLRTEIKDLLKNNNGKLSYDVINEMKYLNLVLQEAMRKYPALYIVSRKSSKPYKIPGYDVILPKDTLIDIPIYSIQYDERYYPNPHEFIPERFSEGNNNRNRMAYLPFGAGPKKCIGGRFAMYEVKLGIITVIKNYKVTLSKLTQVPCKIDKSSSVFLTPANGPRPMPFVGNSGSVIFNQQSFIEKQRELYNKWKHEPFVGLFYGRTPVLLINDLDLIKNILITDFHKFPGRGVNVNKNFEPLEDHLLNLQGHRWKILRTKLGPAFTIGKLKQMIDLIIECSEQFTKYLQIKVKKENVIECYEATSKYTMNVIGSCIFGINIDALEKEDNIFTKLGKRSTVLNLLYMIQRLIHYVAPEFYELPSSLNISKEHTRFFVDFVNKTIEHREQNNIVRHDLIEIFKDIKKNKEDIGLEWTESLLAAQALVFFVAGFETSSKTISSALYELAIFPEIQEKLRIEIVNTLQKHNGQLSYDAINEMKYLDMVMKETLRKYPPATELNRKNIVPYKIPGHDVILPPGSSIHVPIYCIQNDELHYSNPELFVPERFSEENDNKRNSMTYMPFGAGPKRCIGLKFAVYQTKLGLIAAIKNFKVIPSELTQIPYKIDKLNLVLSSENGIHLKFESLI